jgi:6-phosphogluconolactonase
MLRTGRTLLGATLCGAVCACGGGGGSYSSPPPPPPPPTASLIFVTNGTAGTIDVLTIDAKTGVPTPVAGNPMPDGPTPKGTVVDPQKRYLYVVSSAGEVRGYLLNSSGQLSAMSGSPFMTGGPSTGIAMDASGQFVLTANGTQNNVSVFKIGSTGALTEVPGSPFAAGANPDAIVMAGNYVYAGNGGGGSVSAYSMDMNSGSLTAVAGSPFAAGGNPMQLVVDPSGTHLYAAEGPSGIAGFGINGSTGALTTISGSPFTASGNSELSAIVDGAGAYLHAANGTNVDCYTVGTGGALSYIGPSGTGGQALALAVDNPDNFVYALDNVNNQIVVFSIQTPNYSLSLISGNPYPLFSGSGGQALGPNSITVVH